MNVNGPPPRVTVVITAFHRSEFLPDALASVARQGSRPEEVLLVTESGGAPRSGRDGTMRWWDGHPDGGARGVPSFERVGDMLLFAIRETLGDVVCFLDDDDLFEPGKVGAVRSAFTDPSVGYLHNAHTHTDADLREIPWPERQADQSGTVPFKMSAIRRTDADGNLSSISVRRSQRFLDAAALTLPRVTAATDAAVFYTALVAGFRPRVTAERLTRVRVHPGSTGRSPAERPRGVATLAALADGPCDWGFARTYARSALLEARIVHDVLSRRGGRPGDVPLVWLRAVWDAGARFEPYRWRDLLAHPFGASRGET